MTAPEQTQDAASKDDATTEPARAEAVEPAAKETDWKAEARKWQSRAKENSTAAEKLAAIEEASKTEQQKLAERAEAAEKALAESRTESLRSRVALAKGLPSDLADRLRGDDEDSLLEDADRLLAMVKPRGPGDIDQGPRETGRKPRQLTKADLNGMTPQQIVAAKKEGRLSALLTGH